MNEPQKEQQQKPPATPPVPPAETGRNKGDGKKKKQKLEYNSNIKPNKIPAVTQNKGVSRHFDLTQHQKASRIHLTEEEWSKRLPGNR